VGTRRDDITSNQRAQIAIEALSPHRPWGTISRLAKEYAISRQTVYQVAAAGERVLATGLEPGPHGPQAAEKTVWVDRNRLVRGTVVLTEVGVSQRNVSVCLEELLDTTMPPCWVNAELAKVEELPSMLLPVLLEPHDGLHFHPHSVRNGVGKWRCSPYRLPPCAAAKRAAPGQAELHRRGRAVGRS
jgi:hypothetical protein